MRLIKWIFPGICATAAMTLMVNVLAAITERRWQVIRILSTMLTITSINCKLTRKTKALLIGSLVHYFIGVLFSLCYASFCQHGFVSIRFRDFMLFGLAIALIAVIVWRSFIALHPSPPCLYVRSFLIVTALSHFLYAWMLYAVMRFLED